MMIAALLALAAGAVAGIFLAVRHFRHKRLPAAVALFHGLGGATGFALVLLTVVREPNFRPIREVLYLLIATVALQINLFLLGAELFTDFYFRTEEVTAATYLYLGLDGANRLVPWIWSAIALQIAAATILTLHPLRSRRGVASIACVRSARAAPESPDKRPESETNSRGVRYGYT